MNWINNLSSDYKKGHEIYMKLNFLLAGMLCLIVGCSEITTDPRKKIFSKDEINLSQNSTFMKTIDKLSKYEQEKVLKFIMQPRDLHETEYLYPISIGAIFDLQSTQESLEKIRDIDQLEQEIKLRKVEISQMENVVDRQRASQQLVPYELRLKTTKEAIQEAEEAARAATEIAKAATKEAKLAEKYANQYANEEVARAATEEAEEAARAATEEASYMDSN